MMLRAVKRGLVDDPSEVLEAVIGEAASQSPILIVKIVVDDLDGAILGKHADGGVGEVFSVSPNSLAACRRV